MAQFLSKKHLCCTCIFWEGHRELAKTFTYVKIDTTEIGICCNSKRGMVYSKNMAGTNVCPLWEKLPMLK